jgi:hypothetical protein
MPPDERYPVQMNGRPMTLGKGMVVRIFYRQARWDYPTWGVVEDVTAGGGLIVTCLDLHGYTDDRPYSLSADRIQHVEVVPPEGVARVAETFAALASAEAYR